MTHRPARTSSQGIRLRRQLRAVEGVERRSVRPPSHRSPARARTSQAGRPARARMQVRAQPLARVPPREQARLAAPARRPAPAQLRPHSRRVHNLATRRNRPNRHRRPRLQLRRQVRLQPRLQRRSSPLTRTAMACPTLPSLRGRTIVSSCGTPDRRTRTGMHLATHAIQTTTTTASPTSSTRLPDRAAAGARRIRPRRRRAMVPFGVVGPSIQRDGGARPAARRGLAAPAGQHPRPTGT